MNYSKMFLFLSSCNFYMYVQCRCNVPINKSNIQEVIKNALSTVRPEDLLLNASVGNEASISCGGMDCIESCADVIGNDACDAVSFDDCPDSGKSATGENKDVDDPFVDSAEEAVVDEELLYSDCPDDEMIVEDLPTLVATTAMPINSGSITSTESDMPAVSEGKYMHIPIIPRGIEGGSE